MTGKVEIMMKSKNIIINLLFSSMTVNLVGGGVHEEEIRTL